MTVFKRKIERKKSGFCGTVLKFNIWKACWFGAIYVTDGENTCKVELELGRDGYCEKRSMGQSTGS